MTNYPTLLGTSGHAANGQTYGYDTYTYSNVGLGRSAMEDGPFISQGQVAQFIRVKGNVSYLSWRLNELFDAPLTLTLNKDSSSSSLAVSITGLTTGWVTDSTHSVSVVDGDSLDLAAYVGTGTGTGDEVTYDGSFYCVSARFDSTDNTVGSAQLIAAVGSPTTAISPTDQQQFVNFLGVAGSGDTTESHCQFKSFAAGNWQNMACHVENNGFTETTTINNRRNGINGSMAISILAGHSGSYEDTSHSDTVNVNDLLDYGIVALIFGSGNFDMDWIGAHFLATDPNLCIIGGSQGGIAQLVYSATMDNHYYPSLFGGGTISGDVRTTGHDVIRASGLFPYALCAFSYWRLARLHCYVHASQKWFGSADDFSHSGDVRKYNGWRYRLLQRRRHLRKRYRNNARNH